MSWLTITVWDERGELVAFNREKVAGLDEERHVVLTVPPPAGATFTTIASIEQSVVA